MNKDILELIEKEKERFVEQEWKDDVFNFLESSLLSIHQKTLELVARNFKENMCNCGKSGRHIHEAALSPEVRQSIEKLRGNE